MINTFIHYLYSYHLVFVKSQRDLETEMRRLRVELKQTMDMYSAACREAMSAKQKVRVQIGMLI